MAKRGDNLVTRSVVVDKTLWERFKEKAESSDLSLSQVIRRLIQLWLEGKTKL